MKEIKMFEAFDGKRFETEEACYKHEKMLEAFSKDIALFTAYAGYAVQSTVRRIFGTCPFSVGVCIPKDYTSSVFKFFEVVLRKEKETLVVGDRKLEHLTLFKA